MVNVFFVVWRESFEAVLIVGILYSFIQKTLTHKQKALRHFWMGVGGGLATSAVLGYAIYTAQSELAGVALDYFQIGLLVLAAVMMSHMVVWMKKHSRTLKSELEKQAGQALVTHNLWALSIVTAIAIGREGAETVIFLYGMFVDAEVNSRLIEFGSFVFAGFSATALTWLGLQKGLSFFRQKMFFNVTSAILLVTAGSMVITVTAKLIQAELLPAIVPQVWDSSFLLDESSRVGAVISMLTGYQSSPALMTVLIYVTFWVGILTFLKVTSAPATAKH